MTASRLPTLPLLGLALLHYAFVLGASGELFVPTVRGMTFNSMALNLLEGRFDVDPAAIGDEAFERDGRSYAYFGIFPALLRLPLIPWVDLATTQVEGPYRLVAMMLAAAGGAWLVRALAAWMPATVGFPATMLLMAVLFSGPVIMIGARPGIYHEVALWGWALAVWFLALLVPALDPARPPSGRRLSALAALAGCAMLTRPTMGVALLAALALLMVVLAWREGAGTPLARLVRAAGRWRMMAPALIALAFLAVAGGVNQARWGHPLTFADMTLQTQLMVMYPDRPARLEAHGLFDPRRLGLGLVYYFVPVWAFTRDGRFLFHDDIERLFDAFELPPSSFFLSDPLTLALAAIGCVAALRGAVPGVARGPALAVLAGLATSPALMLVAWYMAFRYRVEFMPLFLLAAGIGAIRISHWMADASAPAARRVMLAMAMLLVLQVAAAHAFAVIYGVSPLGPSLWVAPQGLLASYRDFLSR